MHTHVEVDGFDATGKIAQMINSSPHSRQLRVVMLNGVTFAGFNVVDIEALSAQTKLPVIALTDDKPNLASIRNALSNLPKSSERWQTILAAGEIREIKCREKSFTRFTLGFLKLTPKKSSS